MDAKLKIHIQTLDGSRHSLICTLNDNLRTIIARTPITIPPNSFVFCIKNGIELDTDLSLHHQGIKNNDTIVTLVRKLACSTYVPYALKRTDPIFGNYMQNEQKQRELFAESLRVSDLQFQVFESYYAAQEIYDSMNESQNQKANEPQNIQSNQTQTYLYQTDDINSRIDASIDDFHNSNYNKIFDVPQKNEMDSNYKVPATVISHKSNLEASTQPLPLCWQNRNNYQTQEKDSVLILPPVDTLM
ncbi:hypothetical protein TRFO_32065 [Tritrichomonas foetus]|uniref:Ubiquitin-like domain-containing protein n=1 Tax=Tritrichomonas foetus TaxID=1144522 RepID=A0A1J4JUM2_9EUKA|nr:hypothetical protein TRFO_32065 [Tritrichomonas foetus]|eukprot:OHT01220.1 hypothetical protein TRFO_32065 [Tritrichomonas foetus]